MELTRREQEVAEAAAKGGSTRAIAAALNIGTRTVESHLASIYRKLGVANRASLVALLAGPGPLAVPGATDVRAALTHPAGLTPPAIFVGREPELRTVADAAEQAAGGSTTLVLVTGDSGIGKTSLVARWVATDAHDQRWGILAARCTEGLATPFGALATAFEPLLDAATDPLTALTGPAGGVLTTLLPHLHGRLEPLPPNTNPAALPRLAVAAFRHLLQQAGSAGPVALVVEDLQWADSGTVAFLTQLLAEPLVSPLLVLVTHRRGDASSVPGLAGLLEGVTRSPSARQVVLGGLTLSDARELGRSLRPTRLTAETVARCHRATAGNAFLLTQVLRHGGDLDQPGAALPADIVAVITARVRTLPRGVVEALEVAAVAGLEVEPTVVDAALRHLAGGAGCEHDVLREALEAGLLTDTTEAGEPLRFTHDLVRHCVAEAVGSERRSRLHAAVGHALLEVHPGDVRHEQAAAGHLLHSRLDTDRVLAAELAHRVLTHELAALATEDLAGFGMTIAAALPASPLADRARLEVLRAVAALQYLRFDTRGHLRAVREAIDVAHRLPEVPEALALAVEPFRIIPRMGTTDVAVLDTVDEAVARLPGPEHRALRARLRGYAAYQRSMGGAGYVAAGPQAEEALAEARASHDTPTITGALYHLAGTLLGSPDLARRQEVAEELATWRNRTGRVLDPIDAYRFDGCTALQRGDRRAFEEILARLTTAAERNHSPFLQAIGQMWHAALALLDGALDAAADHTDQFLLGTEGDPNLLLGWMAQAAALAVSRNDAPAARPLVDQALADHPDLPVLRALTAWVRWRDGAPDQAWSALAPLAEDGFDELVPDWLLTATLGWATDVVIERGTPTHVRTLLAQLEPFAGQIVVVGSGTLVLGAADRFRGVLLAALGRREAAAAALEDAVALLEAMPAPVLVTSTRRDLERLHATGRSSTKGRR